MRTKTDLGQPGQTEITKKCYSVFFGTKFESQHKESASDLCTLFGMYDHLYESFRDRLETLVENVNLDGDACIHLLLEVMMT